MKIAYGILATVALGLVLFVVTNFLGAREASTSSSGNGGDAWWDWPGYGSGGSETEATEDESVVESVLSYPLDVLRALYATYAT